jgi:hypothetical protein
MSNGWRVFWRSPPILGALAIFSKDNSRYSYFGGVSWGKEEEVSYWHNFCYRKPFWMNFGWILGLFDLLEPLE